MRDKIVKLLDENDERLYHGKVTSKELADQILALLAPELEKAEKYDALCLIKDPVQVERELFLEMTEKAEKWDRVMEIAKLAEDECAADCPENNACRGSLCVGAFDLVNALNQPNEVKEGENG